MNPFERIKGLPKAEEMGDIVFRGASESARKIPFAIGRLATARRREKARVRTLCLKIARYFRVALEVIKALESADIFYQEFSKIFFSEREVKEAKRKITSSIRIVERIGRIYLRRISRISNLEELSRTRREAYGRMTSVLKRGEKYVELARSIWLTMKGLPSISESVPTVVVAGPPNVGKSSLVREISTAKVQVASYPFTTKEISVGHFRYRDRIYQVMDTPGLLDRPMEKRNVIERKSIVCLRYAADLIVFMFDVGSGKYYPVGEQINLYREVREVFRDKAVIPVINKVDALENEAYIREIEKSLSLKPLKISVKMGWGVKELVERIASEVPK